eukprot:c12089_g1_i1.p1 GENE.c12089_g1_i1~~c12089_g1_i1.p1  ORF type:complete len:173 (-),score=38.76 c12089_g1_i1:122-640(-)
MTQAAAKTCTSSSNDEINVFIGTVIESVLQIGAAESSETKRAFFKSDHLHDTIASLIWQHMACGIVAKVYCSNLGTLVVQKNCQKAVQLLALKQKTIPFQLEVIRLENAPGKRQEMTFEARYSPLPQVDILVQPRGLVRHVGGISELEFLNDFNVLDKQLSGVWPTETISLQ